MFDNPKWGPLTYHDDKSNGPFIAKHFIAPSANGAHTLDGGNAIVGNEHLIDDTIAIETLDKLLWRGYGQVGLVLTGQVNARHGLAKLSRLAIESLRIHLSR